MVQNPARQPSNRLFIEALRRAGPSSQASLARITGLSRATINNLVQKLQAEGVVESRQANGRETVISLRAGQGVFIAVRVHARFVHAAVFDFGRSRRTDVVQRLAENEPGSTAPPVVEIAIDKAIAAAGLGRAEITGVAVALEGPILRASGAIASWAWQRLPGWKDVTLQPELAERLGAPTLVDNDANLAALAEWTWGGGKGCDDFLYVTASEGVGGGLIIDGKIYHGGNGLAGEIGHMVVEETGGLCFCGSRGCLSGFASERAILAAVASSDPSKTSLAQVIEAAQAGDAACQRVLFEAGRHLGKALAAAARVIAPSVVAVGGLLGTAEPFLFEGLESAAEIVNLRAIAPPVRFRLAQVRSDEVLLGALAAALSRADHGVSELAAWMRTPLPAAELV